MTAVLGRIVAADPMPVAGAIAVRVPSVPVVPPRAGDPIVPTAQSAQADPSARGDRMAPGDLIVVVVLMVLAGRSAPGDPTAATARRVRERLIAVVDQIAAVRIVGAAPSVAGSIAVDPSVARLTVDPVPIVGTPSAAVPIGEEDPIVVGDRRAAAPASVACGRRTGSRRATTRAHPASSVRL